MVPKQPLFRARVLFFPTTSSLSPPGKYKHSLVRGWNSEGWPVLPFPVIFLSLQGKPLKGIPLSSKVHPFYGQILLLLHSKPWANCFGMHKATDLFVQKANMFLWIHNSSSVLKVFQSHRMPPLSRHFSNLINSKRLKLKRVPLFTKMICATGYF